MGPNLAVLQWFPQTARLVCVRTEWAGQSHIHFDATLACVLSDHRKGAQALEAELDRYKRIVMIAQQRKLFQEPLPYDAYDV